MWQLVSGVFLGWSLGTNDAANVYGTAVASQMIRFWTAAVLCAVFVVIGALVNGQHGIETYRNMTPLGINQAFVATTAAGATVALMSFWRLPVSTSQAIVGSMVLVGSLESSVDLSSLGKVVSAWVGTPIGGALAAIILYFALGKLMNRLHPTLFTYDRGLRWLLVAAGAYGAYALGANNVANVTGAYVGPDGLTPFSATLIGSLSIAFGVLTFSKNVMITVGKRLVKLDAFSAFIAILAEAVTVHIYALVGVPVSTSQALVGAVLGIGIVKGMQTINRKTLLRIVFGWLGTPSIAAAIAYVLYHAFSIAGVL